jgi:C4-dicarboxylate-specific signal transduction histidine kinase
LQVINSEGRIGLLVSDFGPGPDPALGERIYEPFITSKTGEHDGLGLFLARKALEPHQGKVFWREGDPSGFVMDFPSV